MVKEVKGVFDEIMKLTERFVEKQKGAWNHDEWMAFLSDLQKRGIDMTDETQSYLGSILEAMKKLYVPLTGTENIENIEKTMKDITNLTIQFVKKNKGVWDHAGWEKFLKDVQKKGLNLTEETVSYLGGVLEATKELYSFPPRAPTTPKSK